MKMKVIPVQEAVGTKLAHDITEIRPGEFKGAAFRRGHQVCEQDICHLQKLGKNHLYVLELDEDEIHEDEAAAILADALAGDNVVWDQGPREGKINLKAAVDGLFCVNIPALAAFNMVDEVMFATLHHGTLVSRGDQVAATRAIPLVMPRAVIEKAAAIAAAHGGIVSVRPLRAASAALIITGSEVYHGLIEDRFAPILQKKLEALGSAVRFLRYVPDHVTQIQGAIEEALVQGCDLLLITGGMSVDPDDVTRAAITAAGAQSIHYGSAVLPGAMMLTARIGTVPVLGVPACALHHKVTILDVILPRVLAGEEVNKTQLALLGHGGLCRDCPQCRYPHCPFGKGS
ncbi:molybdopterin-binding protein [Desulfosoma caldarium]|uniref:Molybdopterin molybdenumtransferase n=1 Tax=Desulfosoma caldarium TaxID=610254 RepID=A0A3N1ULR9_9BACT|nr:molybdopterin-binding protein [Desulfosoma caldarium]ROQ91033.1 molybdenum cofactor synthesis domain-containing protein [Desulfosoma caldarium]